MRFVDTAQPLQPAEPSAEALSPKSTAIPVAQGEGGNPAVTTEKLDLVGKAKAALTDPEEAGRLWPGGPRIGPQIFKPVGDAARNLGKALLPGSIPEAAVQSILRVPGGGFGTALARGGAAAGAGTALGMAQGKDPAESALSSTAQSVLGETGGAAARGAARGIGALLSKDMPRLQNVVSTITKAIPGFAGKTPEETVSRLVGGQAKKALRNEYKTAREGLIDKYGDPIMQVPALDKLYGSNQRSMQKATAPVSELWTRIDSLSRNLRTAAGDPSRAAAALEKMELVKQADRQILAALPKAGWPADAMQALENIDRQYAKGSGLIRLFSGARDQPTAAQAKKIIQPSGEPTWPELQAAFQHQRGRLESVLAPQEFKAIEDAIMRGAQSGRDVPGVTPNLHWHFGVIPTTRTPHAPIRIGRPEQAAEAVSQAARQGGARVGPDLLGD